MQSCSRYLIICFDRLKWVNATLWTHRDSISHRFMFHPSRTSPFVSGYNGEKFHVSLYDLSAEQVQSVLAMNSSYSNLHGALERVAGSSGRSPRYWKIPEVEMGLQSLVSGVAVVRISLVWWFLLLEHCNSWKLFVIAGETFKAVMLVMIFAHQLQEQAPAGCHLNYLFLVFYHVSSLSMVSFLYDRTWGWSADIFPFGECRSGIVRYLQETADFRRFRLFTARSLSGSRITLKYKLIEEKWRVCQDFLIGCFCMVLLLFLFEHIVIFQAI